MSQCIGRCAGGNRTSYYRRRRHFEVSETPASYNCSLVKSCVRSQSNGCLWLGVEYTGSGMSSSMTMRCKESSPGVCKWFYDPFCTVEAPMDVKNQVDPTSFCRATPNFAPNTWCSDAYSYLLDRKKPAGCPDVKETQTYAPYWYGPWQCIRSCNDKGNYVNVRRVDKNVQCLGTQGDWDYKQSKYVNQTCSWCKLSTSLTCAFLVFVLCFGLPIPHRLFFAQTRTPTARFLHPVNLNLTWVGTRIPPVVQSAHKHQKDGASSQQTLLFATCPCQPHATEKSSLQRWFQHSPKQRTCPRRPQVSLRLRQSL